MLTPSLRKPSRNFGPIVPEATSKHATAELSRLSTGANDWPNDGFAVSARFHPRFGSAVRPSAQLIGHLAAEQIVVALAQVEPELRQYEPRCEPHSRRFRQRGWLSAAEQHQARTPPLATRSRGGGFARAAAAWSGSCSPVTQSEPSGNSVARGADPGEYRRGGGSSQAPRRLRFSLVALRRSQRDRARRRDRHRRDLPQGARSRRLAGPRARQATLVEVVARIPTAWARGFRLSRPTLKRAWATCWTSPVRQRTLSFLPQAQSRSVGGDADRRIANMLLLAGFVPRGSQLGLQPGASTMTGCCRLPPGCRRRRGAEAAAG